MDVVEVPDDVPALVGKIPLEMLDLVIDPRARRVTGNPAHGGEQVLELLPLNRVPIARCASK